MELNAYKSKFKLLFDKFLQNNFELNTYYAETLIKQLENNSDKETCKLLETPFFSDLLLYALSNIDKTTESIKIFVMNLLTLVMRNELQFSKLLHMKGFYVMVGDCNVRKQDISSPTFRLSCIKQATVQIQHFSGLYWVIEHKIWQHIFNSCFENQPSYVLRASYNFISKFIWKLNELDDEANLMIALEYIVKPILTSDYKDIQSLTSDIENTMIVKVKPSIKALLAIFDTQGHTNIDKTVQLLARYFLLEPHMYFILEVTRDLEFAGLMGELCLQLTFASASALGINNTTQTQLQENEFAIEAIAYFNVLYTLIQKRMVSVVIEFSINSILFWSKFRKVNVSTTFQRYGRTFAVDMQLIVILVVPLMCYTDTINVFLKDSAKQDGLSNYILKLAEISTEQVVKGCYLFKTLVEESDKRDIAIIAAKQISRLKGQLSNEQAGIVFQGLYYVLKQHVPTDESGALVLTETKINSVEDATLLSLVIENIKMILREHDINWYDSCEVVCLYNITMNLLKPNRLPSKLVMQALDLINITVKKFLSPDLTLLMESKSGSALNEIGETIKQSMMDKEWEIRDSGMNLLLTCTELSFVKYIPFQKLISANGLITVVAHAACNDPEFYVQAIALKCLTAASRLECIWKETLCAHPNLYVNLTYIVQRHPEGIVRKEAVLALTEIFINQKLNPEFKNLIYKIMSNAALKDLHWEVQLAALGFWRKAIQTHLSYRGMIDGKFPSVTFSREKRKIITLNQDEIQKQLASILIELAQIGCLSILNKCMTEDFNIKVMEQGYVVAKELIEILTKYNLHRVPDALIYFPVSNNLTRYKGCVPMDLSYSPEVVVVGSQDEIIDSILGTNQTELIEKLYEDYVEIKREGTEDEILSNISDFEVMHPNDFLDNFKNNNILNMIEEKKKWNSGVRDLNSVLDEILSLEGGHSHIDVDCA